MTDYKDHKSQLSCHTYTKDTSEHCLCLYWKLNIIPSQVMSKSHQWQQNIRQKLRLTCNCDVVVDGNKDGFRCRLAAHVACGVDTSHVGPWPSGPLTPPQPSPPKLSRETESCSQRVSQNPALTGMFRCCRSECECCSKHTGLCWIVRSQFPLAVYCWALPHLAVLPLSLPLP